MSPTVLKREERRRPITRSMQQPLELGLPMRTRKKSKPTPKESTPVPTHKPKIGSADHSDDKKRLKSLVIPEFKAKINVNDDQMITVEVEPRKGFFKSRVLPVVVVIALVVLAVAFGAALRRMVVEYHADNTVLGFIGTYLYVPSFMKNAF
ncbi:hypothetical protein P7C71_g2098, partial [Lecanoromycetidae sp. Uapishka_2]